MINRMSSIMKKKSRITSLSKQEGFSSLLFIVLVGLSLTVLTVGYMSSMRSLQSSATTAHAQTQAQMQAMIGYQALTEFLKRQSLIDIPRIETIATGTVSGGSVPIHFKKVSCGTGKYCFDIFGKSGGATSIIRSQFIISDELVNERLNGSIFEGGLKVNKLENLTANNVTLEIGGGVISEMGGSGKTYTQEELKTVGINIIPYTPRDFISPVEARKYANYIFYTDNEKLMCARNNYFDIAQSKKIDNEIIIGEIAACTSAITKSNNVWIINSAQSVPAGVLWFDADVEVQLNASAVKMTEKVGQNTVEVTTEYKKNILVNTIISTNHINSKIIELNGNYLATYFEAYAPHHYVLNSISDNDRNARLLKVCPASYPTQYCSAEGVLKPVAEMEKMPATIANILYLSKTLQLSGGKEQQNVHVSYYGNLMANSSAGGTGGSSGKLIGTGTVNIEGNLMVVGGTDMTEMTGDFKLNLSKADDPANFIPVHKKTFTILGIRYM